MELFVALRKQKFHRIMSKISVDKFNVGQSSMHGSLELRTYGTIVHGCDAMRVASGDHTNETTSNGRILYVTSFRFARAITYFVPTRIHTL